MNAFSGDYYLDEPDEGLDPVRCPMCGEPDACQPGQSQCDDCRIQECEVCGDEYHGGDLLNGLCFRELLDLTDNKCVELWETAPTVGSVA